VTHPPVRLRQIVVITRDLAAVAAQVEDELGLRDPFVDPGVAEFGLENRVYAAGDCFLEVLTPIVDGTAGGRYLDRQGGDGGYMAIFQLADRVAPRRRADELGIRVVWQADLDDISGTHLHPADVGGAIVSLDWAQPPESWHWAGPAWRGGAPGTDGGVTSLTVAAIDPGAVAARWAAVLGLDVEDGDPLVTLADAGQVLRFVPAGSAAEEGIVACGLSLPGAGGSVEIAGVRFDVEVDS
jgi:hypothetical protein